jgi:hypothetical protein
MRVAIYALSAAFGFMAAAWVQAADEDHSAHHAAPQSAEAPVAGASGGSVQNSMKRVRDLMAQIQRTEDPEQRRTLLREHLNALREQVRALRAASAHPKMAMMSQDRPQGEQSPASGDSSPAASDRNTAPGVADASKKGMMGGGMMMKMHRRMEQRLDTIEQLLEQLIEREVAQSELR